MRRIILSGMIHRVGPLQDTVRLSEVSGRGILRWRARFARGGNWRDIVFQAATKLGAKEHGIAFQRETWAAGGYPSVDEPALSL